MRVFLVSILALGFVAVADTGQVRADEAIEFKPGKLDFRSVAMGRCRPKKIEATNNSNAAIHDPAFSLSGSNAFKLQSRGKCPNPLEQGAKCRGYVNFCPPLFDLYRADLSFSGTERTMPVTGRGTQGGR